MLHVLSPASRQNDPMPRRNKERKRESLQTQGTNRMAGLGSHWRADGNPKAAYRSQGDGLTAALVRRQESGVELNVYRCDVCAAWHMGNTRGRGTERSQED
jgi:hypothetical protein